MSIEAAGEAYAHTSELIDPQLALIAQLRQELEAAQEVRVPHQRKPERDAVIAAKQAALADAEEAYNQSLWT